MNGKTTGQAEGYTTGCLLHCRYIKNYYRLIAVDLSRQEELNADPRAIQQFVEFVGQLKLNAGYNATDEEEQSIYVRFNDFRKN